MFVLNLYALSWGLFAISLLATVFSFSLYAEGQDKDEKPVNAKLFVLIGMMLTTIILWSVEEKNPKIDKDGCLMASSIIFQDSAEDQVTTQHFCNEVFK